MAIINCPECNEKISSTVNQCVHCGVKITVCPECEKIYTEHPGICQDCGYVFNKETVYYQSESTKEQKLTAPELRKNWKADNLLHTIIEYSNTVLSVLVWGMIVFIFIRFFSWVASLSTLESMLAADGVQDTINTCIVICTIFIISQQIVKEIKPTVTSTMLATWSSAKGISLLDVIKNTFSKDGNKVVKSEKEKNDKDLRMVINAAFLSSNYLDKNSQIIFHTVVSFFICVSDIIMCAFVLHNIEIAMKEWLKVAMYGGEGWKFSMIENWWQFIVFFSLLLVQIMCKEIINTIMDKKRIQWFEKTMPLESKENKKYAVSIED